MMNRMFFKEIVSVFFLFTIFVSSLVNAAQTPALISSESVKRVWVAASLTNKINTSVKKELDLKGFASLHLFGERVVIFSHGQDVYLQASHGSAFAVDSEHLVTNHHVVEDAINSSNKKLFIVTGGVKNFKVVPANVKWHDTNKDLAVIHVSALDFEPLEFSNEESSYITAAVDSIGFPGDSDILGGPEEVGYHSPKIRGGSLATLHNKDGYDVWEHDAAVSGGNSGGPLVNKCGEVLGINTFVHKDNNNVLFAVAAHEVFDGLNEIGVKYKIADSKCDPESSQGLLSIIILVVLGVVLLMLVYLFRLSKQMKEGNKTPSNSQLINDILNKINGPSENQDEKDKEWQVDSEGREFLWDPIRGIVYKDAEGASEQVDSVLKIGQLEAAVDGSNIKKIPLVDGIKIRIGRAGDNDISVSKSSVSNHHLELKIEKGQVFVEDLGSTNGSFLNNKPITKKQAITGVSTIHLAEPSVCITVALTDDGQVSSDANSSITLTPISDKSLPTIVLKAGQLVSVGRSPSNDIVIPEKYSVVSGKHCYLKLHENGQLVVEDSSSNGTFINSTQNRVSRDELKPGDTLILANENIVFKR